ncbi:MAG: M23 family metallopeptidase [Chloroflexi bacterium]|nr:M23 family metallopeptidase [Chloroflexota bacterium]
MLFRLALLLLVPLSISHMACGVFESAAPTPTPTATPTPTSTPTPTPTPTPEPRLETDTVTLAQGGMAVLRVSAVAASAVATFDGQEYPLLPAGDGFWGVIGVGADHAIGVQVATISLYDDGGGVYATLPVSVDVVDTSYPVEQIVLPAEQSALLDPALSQQEAVTRGAVYALFTPERLWSGPFLFPVPGPISSPYGIGRSYNGGPVAGYHHGTDFALDEGTPVAASNAGRVAFAAELPVRGLSVIVDHGAGVFTAYHHLSELAVEEGQAVARGDLVGFVGASGLATGPHLHWELVVGGVELDPVLWTFDEVGP